ncbi:hypothetical protein HHK36_006850 [Tetracentron sinense]|uniref:Uncharacterized protein n=1 Tax=Tetracentron sinense TaxID=13715 RepID=A0A834ZLF1_TETSI|nr:hypothetical protein HHK36_006850 [Tetracentron sinense]
MILKLLPYLNSLSELVVSDFEESTTFPEEFPGALHAQCPAASSSLMETRRRSLTTMLERLEISEFSKLEALSLQDFTSLETLEICACPKLRGHEEQLSYRMKWRGEDHEIMTEGNYKMCKHLHVAASESLAARASGILKVLDDIDGQRHIGEADPHILLEHGPALVDTIAAQTLAMYEPKNTEDSVCTQRIPAASISTGDELKLDVSSTIISQVQESFFYWNYGN